ncbi:MAG: helix-turn-helix domain-containing protein [Granulosicoccus sp.]|nr:helix-turn-helix domain-containing protein [Granulosicoccus sp.]
MNLSESMSFETQSLDTLPTEDFLRVVGQRVRRQRSQMNMSRKRLAEVSGVSERYLAQLESGQGNMSIALLRKVTTAIGMSLGALMSAEVTEVIGSTAAVAQPAQAQVPQSTPVATATASEPVYANSRDRLVSEY